MPDRPRLYVHTQNVPAYLTRIMCHLPMPLFPVANICKKHYYEKRAQKMKPVVSTKVKGDLTDASSWSK